MLKVLEVLTTLAVLVGYVVLLVRRRRRRRSGLPASGLVQVVACVGLGVFFTAAALFGLANGNATYALWGFVAAAFFVVMGIRAARETA